MKKLITILFFVITLTTTTFARQFTDSWNGKVAEYGFYTVCNVHAEDLLIEDSSGKTVYDKVLKNEAGDHLGLMTRWVDKDGDARTGLETCYIVDIKDTEDPNIKKVMACFGTSELIESQQDFVDEINNLGGVMLTGLGAQDFSAISKEECVPGKEGYRLYTCPIEWLNILFNGEE